MTKQLQSRTFQITPMTDNGKVGESFWVVAHGFTIVDGALVLVEAVDFEGQLATRWLSSYAAGTWAGCVDVTSGWKEGAAAN